mmetsp:Transcript_24056/g.44274  ORF Transcript_24056/g.44274 Transcript_24056/m.44274 type:complete len:223 (-) Transcript_24056:959-1627(-)
MFSNAEPSTTIPLLWLHSEQLPPCALAMPLNLVHVLRLTSSSQVSARGPATVPQFLDQTWWRQHHRRPAHASQRPVKIHGVLIASAHWGHHVSWQSRCSRCSWYTLSKLGDLRRQSTHAHAKLRNLSLQAVIGGASVDHRGQLCHSAHHVTQILTQRSLIRLLDLHRFNQSHHLKRPVKAGSSLPCLVILQLDRSWHQSTGNHRFGNYLIARTRFRDWLLFA